VQRSPRSEAGADRAEIIGHYSKWRASARSSRNRGDSTRPTLPADRSTTPCEGSSCRSTRPAAVHASSPA